MLGTIGSSCFAHAVGIHYQNIGYIERIARTGVRRDTLSRTPHTQDGASGRDHRLDGMRDLVIRCLLLLVIPALLGLPRSADAQADTLAPGVAVQTFDSAWRAIRRTHYDTARVGAPWDKMREVLRPRAETVTSRRALRAVLDEMLSSLGESHYAILPGEENTALPTRSERRSETGTAGLTLRLLGGEVVVTGVASASPAADAGVRPGWRVDSIGPLGTAVVVARTSGAGLVAPFLTVAALAPYLDGPRDSTVRVVFQTPEGARTVMVGRTSYGPMSTFGDLPPMPTELTSERRLVNGSCFGVIRFSVWLPVLGPRFDAAVDSLRSCRGMVVDLRGNLGGVVGMVMGASGHFFSQPDTLGVMKMRGSALQLVANPRRSTPDGRRVEPFAGPVAILVDEMTASTSEFFAGGMQARRRARVFGSPTSGQALPAVLLRLPSGDRMMYVIADFTTSAGLRLEGRGVVPDVVVPRTRAGLLAGRDEALEAALAWLQLTSPAP